MNRTESLPMVALRGMTILPEMVAHFDISRERSIEAVQEAMASDQKIFLLTQKDVEVENPGEADLYRVGTVATVKQIIKLPKQILRVLVSAEERAVLNTIEFADPYLRANITISEESDPDIAGEINREAMMRGLRDLYLDYAARMPKITKDMVNQIKEITELKKMVNQVAANMPLDYRELQEILEELDFDRRYELISFKLVNEMQIMNIRDEIQMKVKERVDKHQREYILREQLKLIREELGEDTTISDAEEFAQKAEALDAPDEVKEKLKKEISRFKNSMQSPAEAGVIRTYIETMLEMPWNKRAEDFTDIAYAKELLEAEHYGLEEVKERVLEFLAVRALTKKGDSPILCLVGPPGTGKTSIATDAILNQKDKDVLCIYVAIGQKASSIARVAEDLKKHGAMSYTTIVAATASDSAPLQYIAPYAGTALAEYFMAKGKSVLIVYDDLSKHAVAYRAISLLLRRSPGREAYPGDVFYLHSRLLERSCRMRDDLGGGSITALPIVETQAGDVSAYIPTNVISITDGQIFLESALFNAGNRPAVNVGLSVSRVGGAAQTKAMKKANANLRIELAQYKEMESFAQFSSDLDAETRRQLEHGKALMEMLKQPLCQPKSDAEQVVILVLASHGLLDTLPTAEQREKTAAFVRQFRADVSGTMQKIDADGKLEPDRVDAILNAWKAYAGGNDHVVQ